MIVDQSSGDEAVNDASARRIVQRIFDGNKESFREGRSTEEIPDILIYAEEAHNLLPSDRDTDYRDIWVSHSKGRCKVQSRLDLRHTGSIEYPEEYSKKYCELVYRPPQ